MVLWRSNGLSDKKKKVIQEISLVPNVDRPAIEFSSYRGASSSDCLVGSGSYYDFNGLPYEEYDLYDICLSEEGGVVDKPNVGVVGYFIGGFRPPHLAHFNHIIEAASKCDKLFVVSSTKSKRTCFSNLYNKELIFDFDITEHIFNVFKGYVNSGVVKFIYVDESPFKYVWDSIDGYLNNGFDFKEVKLFVGSKDSGRFDYFINNFGDKYGCDCINVEQFESPAFPNSTDVRQAICDGDIKKFYMSMPQVVKYGKVRDIIGHIYDHNGIDVNGINEVNKRDFLGGRLLLCGGLGGHIMHPYENVNLKFSDLADLVDDFKFGKIDNVVEKTDGVNIFVSWDDDRNVVVFARNVGEVVRGGLTKDELCGKFAGRGSLYDLFKHSSDVISDVFVRVGNDIKEVLSDNKWVSVEIIYNDHNNVIRYGKNYIVFHNVVSFDNDKREFIGCNEYLCNDNLFDRLNVVVKKSQKLWNVMSDVKHNIDNVSFDDGFIGEVKGMIKSITNSSENLSNDSTISDYLYDKFYKALGKLFDKYDLNDDSLVDLLAKRMAFNDKKAITINQLKKKISDVDLFNELKVFLSDPNTSKLKNQYLRPLMVIFIKFGIHVLQQIESGLLNNKDDEAKRLAKLIDNEINSILSSNDDDKVSRLNRALELLSDSGSDDIDLSSVIEGIVFNWKGSVYKLTGIFSQLNKILWLNKK
jgi:hypothetical protein